MREAMHTRLPVYRNTLDEVIGMVHIKDMLPFWGDGADFQLERIKREILFVPHSMRVLDLLLQMRDTGVHMAIVVDEYGGTDGMVTIEDMVEEIVGEIQDEHDKILPPQITELPDGALEADARVEVEELEKRLGLSLLDEERREDVDTLSGLIFTLLDRLPARGEVVHHPAGIDFEVRRRRPAPDQAPAHRAAGAAGRPRWIESARSCRSRAMAGAAPRPPPGWPAAACGLYLAAWLGGGLTALALPPLHLWPALLGFALLLHLLRRTPRRRAAFALGWWFGFGYFLVGLYWIAIAFFSDAERFGALAFPAVALLCAGMALYPALATWLAMLHRWRSPTAAALALAIAWIAMEALRARLFGGFPWNLIGYAWSGSDAISQLGALTGIYGLSLMAVVLGALARRAARARRAGALVAGCRGRCHARPGLDRRHCSACRCRGRGGAGRPSSPGAGQRAAAGQMAAGDAQPLVRPPSRPLRP